MLILYYVTWHEGKVSEHWCVANCAIFNIEVNELLLSEVWAILFCKLEKDGQPYDDQSFLRYSSVKWKNIAL